MSEFEPNQKFSKNPKVTYRDLAEGGVLLDVESGAYHGLNSTGCAIWKLLDGQPTFSAVLHGLRTMLDDAPPELTEEVTRFLVAMEKRGLITAEG
jgi:hypothetical protein